jgi:hypothetical protein
VYRGIGATSIAVCVIALVVSGCGGGSGSSSTSPAVTTPVTTASGMTQAEYVKRGDAICDKSDKAQNASLKAMAKKDPKAESTAAGRVKLVVTAGLPPIKIEAQELAALGAPSGDEAEVQAIVDGLNEAIEKSEQNPASVLNSSANPFTQVDKLAQEYGFKICSHFL